MTEPLRISVGIDPDFYPDLYAKLQGLGKGPRSEMLRVLANEALSQRIRAAAQQAAAAPAAARAPAVLRQALPEAAPPAHQEPQPDRVDVAPAHAPPPSSGGERPLQVAEAPGAERAEPPSSSREAAGRMPTSLLRG